MMVHNNKMVHNFQSICESLVLGNLKSVRYEEQVKIMMIGVEGNTNADYTGCT